MQRVGIVQQRLFHADAERREQERAREALLVHQRDARVGMTVRGIDRLERAERLADVVAGDLAAEVLVEAARSGDGIEGGVRDEAEDLVVDDHPLLAADLGPLHGLGVLGRQMARERVGGLVVVVVSVERIEVHGRHDGLQK